MYRCQKHGVSRRSEATAARKTDSFQNGVAVGRDGDFSEFMTCPAILLERYRMVCNRLWQAELTMENGNCSMEEKSQKAIGLSSAKASF